jgi:hypothetical protein
MRHVCGTGEMPIGFWWGDPKKSNHIGTDRQQILKWIFKEWDWEAGT